MRKALDQLRTELDDFAAHASTPAGHVHLANALALADEFLRGDVTAEERQTCLNLVRLHAEKLKREAQGALKDYLAFSHESLALLFSNMALFAENEFGLSDEFSQVVRNAEFATLFRKPLSKWNKGDYEHFYRLFPSINWKK